MMDFTKKLRIAVFLILLGIIAAGVAMAQESDSLQAEGDKAATAQQVYKWRQPKYPIDKSLADSGSVVARTLPYERIEKYRNSSDFDYSREPANRLSLWRRLQNWLGELIGRLYQLPGVGDWINIVFYIVFGGIIIFVIFRLANIDFPMLKNTDKDQSNYKDVFREDIHQIDFESELALAIGQKEYQMAVRLMYLRALRQLSDQELIKWRPDKTNLDYNRELKQPALRSEFIAITRYFEYAWYGKFPMNETSFTKAVLEFDKFATLVKEQVRAKNTYKTQ
jgi:hypothetical protein